VAALSGVLEGVFAGALMCRRRRQLAGWWAALLAGLFTFEAAALGTRQRCRLADNGSLCGLLGRLRRPPCGGGFELVDASPESVDFAAQGVAFGGHVA
jgi:hypothetical protein